MSARIGVLGTGYWGKNLLRNVSDFGFLAAIADSNPETSLAFSQQYPAATRHATAADMFADPNVDAVMIATPAATHGALTKEALNAGKHVFVEKPLCLDLDEAKALSELADAKGLTLMIGHLLLYHPAFTALRAIVDSGKIGMLRYAYSNRASLGKIRREENVLWSFAPHDISMILALYGRRPQKVTCNGNAWLSPTVVDMTLSHFDFGNGQQAHIFVSWLHPFKDQRLVVVGEEGMVVFNDTLDGDDKLLFYPHKVGWHEDLPIMEKADAIPIAYGDTEPLKEEVRHFIDCCNTGQRPVSDSAEAIGVLSVLDACQTSMKKETSVDVSAS